MARYIDADKLLKKLFPYGGIDKKTYSINAYAVYDAIQKSLTADYEEAIDYLLALACCTTPQLSCRDCPKYKEGHDEDEVTPCESWKDEDILEAVKFIKKMKGSK